MNTMDTNCCKKSFLVCFMLGADRKKFRKEIKELNSPVRKVMLKQQEAYERIYLIEGYENEWNALLKRFSEMAKEKVSAGGLIFPRVSLILPDE